MSEFEYITVLLSIIFGLAMSHLLRGLGVAVHQERGQWDVVHTLWVANAFLLLALNWWVTFGFQAFAEEYEAAQVAQGIPTPNFWTIELFLTLLLWAVFLYMPSVLLFPPDRRPEESYNAVFHRNRFWLMATLIGFLLMDIAQTAFRRALLDPWYYLPFVAHWIILLFVAMRVRRRSVQKFVAWWIFGSTIIWSLGVRRVLALL